MPGRTRLATLVLSLAAVGLCPAAQAQVDPTLAARGGGAMATRSVAMYLQAERSLQDALARRDHAAVTATLAQDFTVRSAASPDAESADEWLQREFAGAPARTLVRDLSTREFDGLAVVSFLLDRASTGKSATSTFFVVDVWDTSTHKLATRSITRAAGAPPRPTRPSGRE